MKHNHSAVLDRDYGQMAARIISDQKRAFTGVTPESDLALINQKALKALTADDVFIFDFELSNDKVDAYYTKMTPASLQSFANSINTTGIPLQPNHESYTFPIGRIFRGEVVGNSDGGQSLICRSYIVRGDLNGSEGISGDALIVKIESGVQKDVSAGFIARSYTCSICGCDMCCGWNSAYPDMCAHYPGEEYDGKVAYAYIEDAVLLEGSLVYHGATPGAMIQKVTDAFSRGTITAQVATRTLARLHSEEKLTISEDTMKGKELLTRLHGKATGRVAEALQKRIEETPADADLEVGLKAAEEAVGEVSAENEQLAADKATADAALEEAQKNVATPEMIADAETGKTERAAAIEATLAEGIRAMGEEFKVEEMKTHLETATIAHVRSVAAQYKQIADSKVEAGLKANPAAKEGEERSLEDDKKPVDPKLYKTTK